MRVDIDKQSSLHYDPQTQSMEEDKWYIITATDDPYENYLSYHGPFNSSKEARIKARQLREEVFSYKSVLPVYILVKIVKVMKG